MVDYRHPLEFGTFITPVNTPAQAPVALAALSERLGYDLVTFQDHPYQPSFADTWTLMTWVAAATERIRVSANVFNLPLRQPAVLARSAATLDLLSGGRVDLALGAGASWDAIEAMGGSRLAPAEAVTALDEAIDVIRGIWDVDGSGPLRVAGTHHRLNGAKRGPAPAHDIPILIGAYKPRMLRLVGTKADGWLPSLSYLKPGDLARGNAVIDEAAETAGRFPREIRRLLNINGTFAPTRSGSLSGPPEQWVEELLAFALEDGISTFILGSDDRYTLQTFAEEVIPALREEVARARGGRSDGNGRSAAALARRVPRIAYDAVPASLAASAVEPGDRSYRQVRSTYLRGGAPGLVLRPETTEHVVEALAFARAQDVPLAIRSGGHGISGRSTNDGGVVIDVGRLSTIEVVDEARRLVRVGPGARWMDVAAALRPYGWALSSGDYGGVGVGGLATAGGIGWLVREHGLTIDHLREVEVVLADGRVVVADEERNRDLFWAIRGAGANFGIVTSFLFQADPVGDIGWGQLVLDATDTAGLLHDWGRTVEQSPRDLTSFLSIGRRRAGQPPLAHVMNVVNSDDPDTIIARLEPIARLAPLLDQAVTVTGYADLMANASTEPHHGQGDPVSRSGLIDHLTEAFTGAVARMLESGAIYFFQIRCVGGAVADVPTEATAYGNRSANFSVTAFGTDRARLDEVWDALHPHFSGLYLSFDTDLREARLSDAFPPATLQRLRALKATYDPANVFRDNFNVPPIAG